MTREQIKQILKENGFTFTHDDIWAEYVSHNMSISIWVWGDSIDININDTNTSSNITLLLNEINNFRIDNVWLGDKGDYTQITIEPVNGYASRFYIR